MKIEQKSFLSNVLASGEDGEATIESMPSSVPSKGFTICFRANFKIWNWKRLFKIDGLVLDLNPHDKGDGYLYDFNYPDTAISFTWSKSVVLSSGA